MTDSKQNETIQEIFTVDVNHENQTAIVQSSKHKAEFRVGKPRYALFFTISSSKASVPNSLSGKYTSLNSAIDAIVHYIKNTKETFAVRSEALHQERQLRKNAEPKSSNGK